MKTVVLCTSMLAAVVSAVLAADTPIAFKDLPRIVQRAMLKEATGATINHTLIELENGKTYYECETILNGKTRDFLVDPQGKVTEVEDQVALDEVPPVVKATVQRAAAGGGKITKLESVKRSGRVVGYEAIVVSKGGTKVGLEMNTDGTLKK